jgi:hypothetical protein
MVVLMVRAGISLRVLQEPVSLEKPVDDEG